MLFLNEIKANFYELISVCDKLIQVT